MALQQTWALGLQAASEARAANMHQIQSLQWWLQVWVSSSTRAAHVV